MVSTYIDRAAEILQEINKLAAFIQEMSDKFDCLYPLDEEDEDLIDDETVVASDLVSDEELAEIEQQCLDFHGGTDRWSDSDSE